MRGARGRKIELAFLGSPHDGNPWPCPPSALFQDQWGLGLPSNVISVDAGSMHPRSFDSVDKMANLPQFYEFVTEGKAALEAVVSALKAAGSTVKSEGEGLSFAPLVAAPEGFKELSFRSEVQTLMEPTSLVPYVRFLLTSLGP